MTYTFKTLTYDCTASQHAQLPAQLTLANEGNVAVSLCRDECENYPKLFGTSYADLRARLNSPIFHVDNAVSDVKNAGVVSHHQNGAIAIPRQFLQ